MFALDFQNKHWPWTDLPYATAFQRYTTRFCRDFFSVHPTAGRFSRTSHSEIDVHDVHHGRNAFKTHKGLDKRTLPHQINITLSKLQARRLSGPECGNPSCDIVRAQRCEAAQEFELQKQRPKKMRSLAPCSAAVLLILTYIGQTVDWWAQLAGSGGDAGPPGVALACVGAVAVFILHSCKPLSAHTKAILYLESVLIELFAHLTLLKSLGFKTPWPQGTRLPKVPRTGNFYRRGHKFHRCR